MAGREPDDLAAGMGAGGGAVHVRLFRVRPQCPGTRCGQCRWLQSSLRRFRPGPATTAPADYGSLAKDKVAAVKKMADGVNDPSGVAVLGAYEEFVNIPLEIKDYPNEAKEILEIYNKQLKGKLKGEVAAQMQQEMARYQSALAGKK